MKPTFLFELLNLMRSSVFDLADYPLTVMRETSVSLPNQKIRQKAKSENFSLYLLVSHRTDLVLFRFAI